MVIYCICNNTLTKFSMIYLMRMMILPFWGSLSFVDRFEVYYIEWDFFLYTSFPFLVLEYLELDLSVHKKDSAPNIMEFDPLVSQVQSLLIPTINPIQKVRQYHLIKNTSVESPFSWSTILILLIMIIKTLIMRFIRISTHFIQLVNPIHQPSLTQ